MPETDVERADRIVEKLARDPKVQQIVADARLFDELRTHPAWHRLYDMVRADQERVYGKLAARFIKRSELWPTPEEVAYYRGFYQGAIFVLSHPEHAEANLEKAAKVAWRLYGDEQDDQED